MYAKQKCETSYSAALICKLLAHKIRSCLCSARARQKNQG